MNNNQTIGQFLGIKTFPYRIKNEHGNVIYYETSMGDWAKYQFDAKGNEIYYESSNGLWIKRKFDPKGNLTCSIRSNGFWVKKEYDDNGKEIYFESSNGIIIDKRPKPTELTLSEIASKLNIPLEQLRIKE